jgi:hypothetical protein
MPRTRILIADLPTLLRDIVLATVAPEPDLEVVGVVKGGDDITHEVRRTGATVVIVGARPATTAAPPWRPDHATGAPAVVVVTPDGRDAVLHLALGELSPRRLVDTLRRLPTMLDDDPAPDDAAA